MLSRRGRPVTLQLPLLTDRLAAVYGARRRSANPICTFCKWYLQRGDVEPGDGAGGHALRHKGPQGRPLVRRQGGEGGPGPRRPRHLHGLRQHEGGGAALCSCPPGPCRACGAWAWGLGLGLTLPTAEEVPRTLRRDLAKMKLFCGDYIKDETSTATIDQIALSIR